MKLSAPSTPVFLISVVLAVLGILGGFDVVQIPYSFYLLAGGYALLAVANLLRGM